MLRMLSFRELVVAHKIQSLSSHSMLVSFFPRKVGFVSVLSLRLVLEGVSVRTLSEDTSSRIPHCGSPAHIAQSHGQQRGE